MKTLFLLGVFSAAAYGQAAYVNSCSAQSTSGAISIGCSIAVTAGNQLLVAAADFARTLTSITDNSTSVCGSGNTYVQKGSHIQNNWDHYVYFAPTAGCTGTITITATFASAQGGGTGPYIGVQQYSGVANTQDGSTVDGVVTPTSGNTVFTCGSMTTTNANDVIFASLSGNEGGNSRSWSASGGFTLRTGGTPAVNNWIATAGDIVSATGTYTPVFTGSGGEGTTTNSCIVVAMRQGSAPTNLCSSIATGNASSPSTWTACGGGTPMTAGFTAAINDGHTVTWDTTSTTGLGTTTPAITLNNSGKLTIKAGVTLTVNGPITYVGGSGNTTDGITMQPGSSLVGVLVSGVTGLYGSGMANGLRAINSSACTAASRCAISASGAGASTIGDSGLAGGGSINLVYTDLSGIGDASHDAIYVDASAAAATYSVQHSHFTNCGRVNLANTMAAGASFTHSFNAHTGGLGANDIAITATANKSGGTRLLSNSSLTKGIGGSAVLGNFTVTDNYIVDTAGIPAAGTTNAIDFERNIVVVTSGPPSGSLPQGTLKDNYAFFDSALQNPHYFLMTTVAQTLTGFIVEQTLPNPFSGVVFLDSQSGAVASSVTRTILLPTTDSGSNAEISNPQGSQTTGKTYTVDHNTLSALKLLYGHVNINETGASPVHQYTSVRNNAFFSYPAFCTVNCIAKMWDNACSGTNNTDPVDPANADYNFADASLTLTRVGCTGDPNQGNGYNGAFSVTPGAHDQTADPRFADIYRSLIFFPSKYLGQTATGWVTGTAYTAGQTVSRANAAVYGGLTVLYRCKVSHTSGASTEPGVGSNWTTDWKWEGLPSVEADLSAEKTYVDGALPGCTAAAPCGAVAARIAWIRRGFTPTNPVYRKAGSDGKAPGAVDMDGAVVPVMVR